MAAMTCGKRTQQPDEPQDIVVWHEMRGYSPDEVVDFFPGITLADVYAALAYYHDNRQEIEEEFRRAEECAEWVKANIPSKIPAELRERTLSG